MTKSNHKRTNRASPYSTAAAGKKTSIDLDNTPWTLGREQTLHPTNQPSTQRKVLSTALQNRLGVSTSTQVAKGHRQVFSRVQKAAAVAAASTTSLPSLRVSIQNPQANRPLPEALLDRQQTVQIGRQMVKVGGMASDQMDTSYQRASVVGPQDGETAVQLNNLHWEVTAEDLEHFFKDFGPLKKVRIHYDLSGRSEGKATVLFPSSMLAQAAIQRHNGAQLDGLVLQMAMPGLSAGRQGIVGAASQPAPLPASLASRLGNTNGPVQTSLRRTNRMDNVVVTKTVLPPASFKVILH